MASVAMEIKVATDNTDKVLKAAKDAVLVALEAVGLQAEGYAKRKCAVDTGLLRNSITHSVGGMNFNHDYKADRADRSGKIRTGSASGTLGEDNDLTAYIGTNVEYAPHVEYGTIHMKAQPFLKPAVAGHAEEYRKIFEAYLKDA